MDELDQLWVPEVKDWRLNERHYGDLIGKTKPETVEGYGAENVALWASSYDVPPPPMSTTGRYYPKDDQRCARLLYPLHSAGLFFYRRAITCAGGMDACSGDM